MTPEAIRCAIAEACGFAPWGPWPEPAVGEIHAVKDDTLQEVPDYLNDLNAMHEAEKWLKEQPDHEYSKTCIYSYDAFLRRHFGPRATAAQRAQAFLRTIGKWEDSK